MIRLQAVVIKKFTGKLDKAIKAAVAASKTQIYIGVPQANSKKVVPKVAKAEEAVKSGRATKKQKRLASRADDDVNNAELLYIHTKGSPKRKIPARPIIEPAVNAPGNKEKICRELADMATAAFEGKTAAQVKRHAKRAALAGQNAVREWFTDPRNGWKPNTPGTIEAKGSDRPLIDTGSLRSAIVGVVIEKE